MSVEIRTARPEEHRRLLELITWAFGGEPQGGDEDRARFFALFDAERLVAADDGGEVVGGAGSLDFRMSVPGGADVACAGVTIVAVSPSHRRRGILTGMMRRLLDEARSRGEPLAALFASEGAIYGRFGFAWAVDDVHVDADVKRIAFRDPPEPGARVRLLSDEEALAALPPLYERERGRRAGLLARDERWWRDHRLFDPEFRRYGGGPMFRALLELDGEPAGYVLYRFQRGDEPLLPDLRVAAIELLAPTPVAARELWRYLFSLDLVSRVRAWCLPADDPLPLLVDEPARLRLGAWDGLWLRLVDVGAALSARALGPGDVVLEVDDAFCPWNAGRWRVAAGAVERTDAPAELALSAADLAAAYLGGFTVARLAAAGRVRELRAGAVERADALLRTQRAPWSPEIF